MTTQPDEESREQVIARRAHELYEARGGEDGQAEEDWLAAEAEIGPDPNSKAPVEPASTPEGG